MLHMCVRSGLYVFLPLQITIQYPIIILTDINPGDLWEAAALTFSLCQVTSLLNDSQDYSQGV